MILIVDLCHGKDSLSAEEFVKPVVAIAQHIDQCKVKHFSELKGADIEDAHKIILCGTARRDDSFRKNLSAFGWLKSSVADKPILGICAGMQAIGLVFGCRLVECKEIGMWKIMTKRSNSLFSGVFEAYELHGYAVNPSPDFEILAKSNGCAQVMKHRSRQLYGVQFHPEVRNPEIIERFLRL